MYVVISKWEFNPADEAEVVANATKMMATIHSWPEVEMAFNVRAGEGYVLAVLGYTDQAAYERLIQDPNGPFERAAAEHGLEQNARWVWSERGDRVDL